MTLLLWGFEPLKRLMLGSLLFEALAVEILTFDDLFVREVFL